MTPAVANSADAGSGAVAAKRAFQIDWAASGTIQATVNSTALFDTTVGGGGTALTLGSSNKDLQISNIQDLNISLELNGVVKQKSNTSNMIFSVNEIISDLSQFFTLAPGDLL